MTELNIAPFIEAESDRIVADDLIAGPQTYTVTAVKGMIDEKKKNRLVLTLDGSSKPFIPCKGMARLMGSLWGADAAKWVGKVVTLYRDPDVRFGADMTGGVRICAASNIEATKRVPIRVSQKAVKTYNVDPISTPPAADPARKWADGYIRAINEAPTLEALNDFANGKAVKLAELASKKPDMHAECVHALDLRREAFSTDQGRTDEQHGDQFADDEGF